MEEREMGGVVPPPANVAANAAANVATGVVQQTKPQANKCPHCHRYGLLLVRQERRQG